jgi:hypothetical protein
MLSFLLNSFHRDIFTLKLLLVICKANSISISISYIYFLNTCLWFHLISIHLDFCWKKKTKCAIAKEFKIIMIYQYVRFLIQFTDINTIVIIYNEFLLCYGNCKNGILSMFAMCMHSFNISLVFEHTTVFTSKTNFLL